MRPPEIDPVAEARETLTRLLNNIPNLTVEGDQPSPSLPETAQWVDFTLKITHEHRLHTLAVVVKPHGFPQRLREAVNQLIRYRYKTNRNDDLVVAAPYITPEGGQVCRDDHVSYFDLAGNCRLAIGTLYIERTGIANPHQKNVMAAPSLYGMRGERVLRTLLTDPKKPWKGVEMARQTGVSMGTVSSVRKLLTERDWVKETPEGMLLTQPEKLLREWAQVWRRRTLRPVGYFSRLGISETEQALGAYAKTQKNPLALTGAAAAWRYAPMTRYQRTQVYWGGEPNELAEAMDWKKAEAGANVQILAPRDQGVFDFAETHDGIPIVSLVQTFLDLQHDPARGEEAAEQLWQTRLFHV
jgi:hypothetical protein